jgi:hypothetical protein
VLSRTACEEPARATLAVWGCRLNPQPQWHAFASSLSLLNHLTQLSLSDLYAFGSVSQIFDSLVQPSLTLCPARTQAELPHVRWDSAMMRLARRDMK